MLYVFVDCGSSGTVYVFRFCHGKMEIFEEKRMQCGFCDSRVRSQPAESFRVTHAMMITIGVILCILSVLPVVIVTSLFSGRIEMYPVLMFVLIGIGVFLFVAAGNVNAGFTTLLSLNKSDTMGGSFVPSQNR